MAVTTTAGRLWQLMSTAARRRLLLLLMAMFVGMALETLGVGLVVPLVALFTQEDYASRFPALQPVIAALGNPGHTVLVVGAMVVLVAVYLFKTAFLAWLAWQQSRFAYGVQAQLSERLFTTYLHQPYTFHLQRNSAQLIRNMTVETSTLVNSGLMPGLLLLAEFMVLLGLFALLLAVEPQGALMVIAALGLAGGAFYRVTRARTARWGSERQRHEGYRIQHLQQGLGGVKDVKLLGREAEFLEQYRSHNLQLAHIAQKHTTLQQMPRLWLELLAVIGLAALVVTMVLKGSPLESILPTLALFAAAAFRIMPSANRIIGGLQSLRYGLAAIDTLHAELQILPVAPTRSASTQLFRNTVELSDVTFAYPGVQTPALHKLSLVVRRGESVGFIGTSGSGKSTLVDVLLGLLTPSEGRVLLDGADIHSDLRGWQAQVGYVAQSIYLTDDTLRRNIAFGLRNEHIDEAAVWRALRAAQLDEFVSGLPQGLDTVVGERGVRISGGQRQRIGIARALYHDPEVLVLDEATSSLDIATERGVMQSVMALQGGKTLLIVAHRLSTVERCDRLYQLENGTIVADGSPASILRAKSVVQ